MCFGQPLFLNNTGQNGKGRDTHGNPDKEGEREKRRPFMSIRSIDIIGCQHTEEKRHDRTGVADQDGLFQFFADFADIQFHTDGKHEKNEAELA